MVCIASIAAHDAGQVQRIGLRRALATRRANLGDCPDAPALLRRLAFPHLLRHPACVMPLTRRSGGEATASDLGLRVGREALQALPELAPAQVGALLYCHGAPDASATDSTAGRLQFELALPQACAFSISQAHNSAPFIALDIAAGLIAGPETMPAVLLVAADKLVFGKPPHAPRDMVWSDVAAAAVLTRDAASGWHLLAVRLGHFPASVRTSEAWPPATEAAFAGHAADALRDLLAAASLPAHEVQAVIAGSADPEFVARVHRLAQLRAPLATAPGRRSPHAACADVLARLARLEGRVAPGGTVLAWCHGNNGEFACALLTRLG